jgi:hypothetical protein
VTGVQTCALPICPPKVDQLSKFSLDECHSPPYQNPFETQNAMPVAQSETWHPQIKIAYVVMKRPILFASNQSLEFIWSLFGFFF